MPNFAAFSHDDFVAAVRSLADQIRRDDDWQPNFLIGIGRGGLAPAVYLSHATGVAMLSVDVSAPLPAFNAELLAKLAERTRAGERLLFIDDINDSGGTIVALHKGMTEAGGEMAAVRFATLIDNSASAARVEYGWRTIDRRENKDWFVFPWEAMAPAEALAEDAAEVPERIA